MGATVSGSRNQKRGYYSERLHTGKATYHHHAAQVNGMADEFPNPSFVCSVDQFLQQEEQREQRQRVSKDFAHGSSTPVTAKIDRFAQRLALISAKVTSRELHKNQQHDRDSNNERPERTRSDVDLSDRSAASSVAGFVPTFTFNTLVSPLAPPSTRITSGSTASEVTTGVHSLAPTSSNCDRTQKHKGDSVEPCKLPLLNHLLATEAPDPEPHARRHGRDPAFTLERSQLEKRFCQQQLFTTKAEQNALEEQKASVLLEDASRAAEQVRIATAIYSQNEKSWSFDERAKKTQELSQLKSDADQASRTAQQQVERLTELQQDLALYDPYRDYRPPSNWNFALAPLPNIPTSVASRVSSSQQPASSPAYSARGGPSLDRPAGEELVVVWLLGTSTNAPPSTASDRALANLDLGTRGIQKQFAHEKQLSHMTIYYVATAPAQVGGSSSDHNSNCYDDKPPELGWRCCSHYGASPPPVLKFGRGTSVDTILVHGAGAAVVNGRYILNGKHHSVDQFKSVSGIELFRKAIPKSSATDLGLNEIPPVTTNKDSGETEVVPVAPKASNRSGGFGAGLKTNEVRLPRVLENVADRELDFNVMRRIGAWMGHHPPSKSDKDLTLGISNSDSKDSRRDDVHVTLQASRNESKVDATTKPNDLCLSTAPHAPVCSEWVLFLKCQQHQKGFCTRRHYYISHQEKLTKLRWAYHQESDLEKNVLSAIILREHSVDTIRLLGSRLMQEFQENLPIKGTLKHLLREMNLVRYLSVRVLEIIEEWRKLAAAMGFARLHDDATAQDQVSPQQKRLEWSCSITLKTGKLLYKGSNAFESRVKRFRRDQDATGKKEMHVIYLGCYGSKMEAEKAYDDAAMVEARRLNIPFAAMPLKRLVLKSCGKHFAIESDHLGPSYCIECQSAMQRTMTAEDWTPPFNYASGENYILKMASDLDFLNDLVPLRQVLNKRNNAPISRVNAGPNADSAVAPGGDAEETFPLLGNAFLLPKTPLQDPELAFFTTLTIPLLHVNPTSAFDLDSRLAELQKTERDSNEMEEGDEFMVLGRDRLLHAQRVLLRELEIYKSEQDNTAPDADKMSKDEEADQRDLHVKSRKLVITIAPLSPRVVEALYWDRCAALSIKQTREPLAFRQRDVWCRPDAGEWHSLVPRGKHILHYNFEMKLKESGEQLLRKRQQVLALLRDLLKKPLYQIHSRDIITTLISEAMEVKGDVVFLTLKSVNKYLDLYDLMCVKTRIVQRWFRGVMARIRAKAHQRLLQIAYQIRRTFLTAVSAVARDFYHEQMNAALRRATRAVCTPFFRQALTQDHESVIVSVHLVRFDPDEKHISTSCFGDKEKKQDPKRFTTPWLCVGCARRFVRTSRFEAQTGTFRAVSCHVCTCNRFVAYHPRDEKWLIRAYNPSTNLHYRLQLNSPLILQLISALNPRRGGNYTGQVSRQELLRIDWCDDSEPGSKQNQPLADKWNPITKTEEWQRFASELSLVAQFHHRQARECFDQLQNWRQLSADALRRRKNASITLDKAKTNLELAQAKYATLKTLASKAMKFASKPVDSAQAWDPVENANDWQLLTKKRSMELNVLELEQFVEQSRFLLFQAVMDEAFCRVMAHSFQQKYDLLQQQEQNSELQAEEAEAQASFWERLALASVKRICSELVTLRDTFLAPTRRQLTIKCPVWERWFRASIPGKWRGRSCLCRRVIKVCNGTVSTVHKELRMVVQASVECSDWNAFFVSGYDPMESTSYEVFIEWPILEMILRDRRRNSWRQQNVRKLAPGMANRHEMCQRAAYLVSRAMLDPYTDAFSLCKLNFFQILRIVSVLIRNSLWYKDAVIGRKGGVGDEITRQSVVIDGKLFYATVYENWGDLFWILYHPRTTETHQIQLRLSEIIHLLSTKPFHLQLWIASVISNNYPTAILKYLTQFFRLVPLATPAASSVTSARRRFVKSQLIFSSDATRVYHRKHQRVLRIDAYGGSTRLVIVRFFESTAQDLLVKAYDWHQNFTYVMELERESIRRLFNAEADPDFNLLLRRNQHKLFDAICSRLTFQSVFHGYYDMDQSIGFGSRVRQSLDSFNNWLSRSKRNPLQPIATTVIDAFAAQIDAGAFSTLLFDRLTLLGTTVCATKLQLLQTVDARIDSFGGPNRLLKLDVFKSHHDFVLRLRDEIASEFAQRNEQANQQQMEREETLCFVYEIDETLLMFRKETDFWLLFLMEMKHFLVEKQQQRQTLHQELLQYTKERNEAMGMMDEQAESVVSPDLSHAESGHEPNASGGDDQDPIDMDLKLYELLQLHSDLRDFFRPISSRIPESQLFRFFTLEGIFAMVQCYILDVVRALVATFVTRLEDDIVKDVDLAEVEGHQLPLEHNQVHTFWKELAFYFNRFVPITVQDEAKAQQQVAVMKELSSMAKQAITGLSTFVIPAKSIKPMEEVYLASLELDAWRLLFETCVDADHELQLTLRSVSLGGILVFDDSPCQQLGMRPIPWNPRASALAGQPVIGMAVYCCSASLLNQQQLKETSLVAQITQANHKYQMLFAEEVESFTQPKRSTTLLPWKVFATRRLQIARTMRKNSLHALLRDACEAQKDYEQEEQLKDKATLAMGRLSHRHAEFIFGEALLCDPTMLGKELASSMKVTASTISGRYGTIQMQSPRMLCFLLQHCKEEKDRLVSSASTGLRLSHIRVEVDDITQPNRLVFGCCDTTNQQRFFVDFDQCQACNSLGICPQTVDQWRRVAAEVLCRLEFVRRNGANQLWFKPTAGGPINPVKDVQEEVTNAGTSVNDEAPSIESIALSPIEHNNVEQKCIKSHRRLRQEALILFLCGRRRLLKHAYANLLQFLRVYVARESRSVKIRCVHEWMSMASEDTLLLKRVPAPPMKTLPPELEECDDPEDRAIDHEQVTTDREQNQKPVSYSTY